MEIFYVLMGAVLAWFGYESWKNRQGHINTAAHACLKEFEKWRSSTDGIVLSVANGTDRNPKFMDEYDKWEKQAKNIGFEYLGDLKVESEIIGGRRIATTTSVLTNKNRDTILAYAVFELNGKIHRQTEIESHKKDGAFLYSTDNPLTYGCKQPDSIKINILNAGNIEAGVASHYAFISQETGELAPYDSIEAVLETTRAQSGMRRQLRQSFEMPISEEELNVLLKHKSKGYVRALYKKMREIKGGGQKDLSST